MLSSNDKKLEKMDPFYRPSVSKQKTSAEIISEARNALQTVRTQRPFTPQEVQRKLFGPSSSRTPESRPPSSFSLHASSFESSDCRPILGTRLSPLELDLVVRIVFILGNLTAKNNEAREHFAHEKGSIQTLLSLFQTYQQLDLHSPRPARPRLPSEAEDVLIKLTRVLANIAIHPRVGPALAAELNPSLLGPLTSSSESKTLDDCEELVINTTATINNLSFYQVKNSIIQDKKLCIAELLLKLLVSKNMDGILEAVRVFGNLSQDHDICNFIVQNNVHKFMIALLDAKHQDLCFSACGVLLNLTVDKDKRIVLKEGGGIKKLVDCLRDFGPTDWQLACLVCKTLWNFSENTTNPSACFGDEDTNTLLVLLSSFLDEELALDNCFDQDLKNYHKLHWEREFKPVGQQLLSRIQSHHTFLEPRAIPSLLQQTQEVQTL
ncbi:Armadillo repeat-containing protein 2 [Fukomys damarensis]|uniref:Armadillo repeat-containing protein 2 n=1 Tax=Fukomys damarensis TaxID=885580 RepID=A0A091E0S1_FUKDA|nr:Armadillo repeat-containing protein 2 [Fukomys damarensis]